MAGEKPAIKVVAKSKAGGGQPITLLAAWRGERGLNGRLDRSIASITIRMADGSTVTIDRDEQGRESHWINVYDNASDAAPRATRSRPSAGSQRSGPIDDMPDDDLPF